MTGGGKLLLGVGAAAPPAAWFAAQQAAGGLTYFACARATPFSFVFGVLGVLACAAAAAIAWRSRIAAEPTAQFAAQVGLGLAAIFGLTNLIMVAAIVLIPPCAR